MKYQVRKMIDVVVMVVGVMEVMKYLVMRMIDVHTALINPLIS